MKKPEIWFRCSFSRSSDCLDHQKLEATESSSHVKTSGEFLVGNKLIKGHILETALVKNQNMFSLFPVKIGVSFVKRLLNFSSNHKFYIFAPSVF